MPALYAQVQSYLVLLNRQRVERTQSYTHQAPSQSPPSTTHHHHPHHQTHKQIYPHPPPTQPTQPQTTTPIRGRPLVINSSISLIKAFMFFRYRSPGVLISWALGQQAFNACMILLLDALENATTSTADENGSGGNEWLVEQAFVVFRELEANGVHRLAELAVGRLSEGLMRLGQVRAERERRRESGQDVALGGLQGIAQHSQSQTPMLGLNAASMMDWTGEGESVMGQTGMFLLEDHGLQSYHPSAPPAFRPLSWAMAGSGTPTATTPAGPSTSSTSPTPYGTGVSPVVPVSQVTAAPFPIMTAPPFIPAGGVAIPVTNSPFAVGLQPRLTGFQQQQQQQAHAPYQHQHVQQRRQGRAGSGSGSVGTSGQGYGQFFGGFDVGAAFPGEQGMAGLPGPSRQGGMGMVSASEMGGQAYGTQHQHQQHSSQQQRRSASRQQGGRVERIPRSSQRRR